MGNSNNSEKAALRLAELSREVEELENGRVGLLNRVEQMREELQQSGQRTAAMRASVDLLCEHLTNIVETMADLQALEQEIQEIGRGLDGTEKQASNLAFEAESLRDTVDEAEEELERLSAILGSGRAKQQRGH